jgi:hypothetical protein
MDFASNTLADRYPPRSALARRYEPPAGLQCINAKVEEADDVSEPRSQGTGITVDRFHDAAVRPRMRRWLPQYGGSDLDMHLVMPALLDEHWCAGLRSG